jgi:hypothetical protein
MSTTPLKLFQTTMRDALVHHFDNLRSQYDAAATVGDKAAAKVLRFADSALILQAPTGVGKTLLAVETVQDFSVKERIIWFWFVPFTGLIGQARRTFQAQAPAITLMDVATDRFVESLRPGGVYILSWQTVAAKRAESRIVRETRDEGLSVDELIAQARDLGYRIGCVVDEAHHGFHRGGESTRFFAEVLQPDYTLMMTATPRDEDAVRFSEFTGYRVGPPDTWPTISREQGVEAGLLKADVKSVRFLARRGMEERIVDFERLALAQCWQMHEEIKKELVRIGVGITPLMLVQVPNGASAAADAEAVLVSLGVPASKIRKHTADEPDDNLAAIANDPDVEVLIFKMAIAMGFDAPRAFTLAALRGVRDQNFGIQVVGRIMRVHRLLQGRADVSELLSSGYVFLANDADQEGLTSAAEQINEMAARQPFVGAQSLITVTVGETSSVQYVSAGQTLEIPLGGLVPADADETTRDVFRAADSAAEWLHGRQTAFTLAGAAPGQLQGTGTGPAGAPASTPAPTAGSSLAGVLAAASTRTKTYTRKPGVPKTLKAEVLPPLPDNIEAQIVAVIDFTPVLGDRERQSTQVTRRTEGLFDEESPVDDSVLAKMSPAVLAERAKQIALEFNDLDSRDFLGLLEERFKEAMTNYGITAPTDPEILRQQLDLVLVRNPKLIREAQKRVRARLIRLTDVELALELVVPVGTKKAARNIYGVFPPDLNTDELAFAEILDTDSDVVWWHRNTERKATSVVLYAWSGGAHAFFPDFVLALEGREYSEGIVLAETKGPHLLQWEKAKAGARHNHYGRVFMVGKQTREGEFQFWRLDSEDLVMDGTFEVARMKFDV